MVMQLSVMGRVLVLMGSVFTFMGMGMVPSVARVFVRMSMCMKVFMIMQVSVLVGMSEVPMSMFVRMSVSMRMRMTVLMLVKSFHVSPPEKPTLLS
jgi:hypothetical protein